MIPYFYVQDMPIQVEVHRSESYGVLPSVPPQFLSLFICSYLCGCPGIELGGNSHASFRVLSLFSRQNVGFLQASARVFLLAFVAISHARSQWRNKVQLWSIVGKSYRNKLKLR